MSRNGAGTYTLAAGNPVVTGTTISSTWANNTLSDIATALTQSLAKDGQTVPTANIPMGSFKLTGLGAPTTAGDALAYGSSLGAVTATTGTFSGNVQMASANGGQLAGLRNKIINGNMGIFQRGTTAVTITGAYGPADRWSSGSLGNTFSTSQGSFVSGDTLYDTGGAQYFTTVAVTSVANAANYTAFNQRMEDVRILAGQTVTVSFWAKAASGTPSIGLEVLQSFGTGGSQSADANGTGQAQALTTTWTQYSKTFTVPSINGKTIGTTANTSYTSLVFWLDAGSSLNTRSGSIGQSSKTVSIAQVQVEIGSVSTPFEFRPYGMELALCQRYFQKSYQAGTAPGTNSTVSIVSAYAAETTRVTGVVNRFPVVMRAQPSMQIYSETGSLGLVSTTAGVNTGSTMIASLVGDAGFGEITGTGLTANTVVRAHWTASAEL
jgi:hypothetical protein